MKQEQIQKDLKLSAAMCRKAYQALDDKQGVDIKILDIHEISVLADYFIIAHGNNPNHVRAMIDEVEEKLAEAGYDAPKIEGYTEGTWVLMDCGRIIVHVFHKEARLFYDLERIWSEGRIIAPEELPND